MSTTRVRMVIICVLVYFFLTNALYSYADSAIQNVPESEITKLTEALNDIKDGDLQSAQSTASTFKSEFARNLFEWSLLNSADYKADYDELTSFVKIAPNWPNAGGLASLAEKRMPADISDKDLISWYNKHTPYSFTGMNRYIQALSNQGQKQTANTKLNNWWTYASLNVKEQQLILAQYGLWITKAAHIKRLNHLINTRGYSNAKILSSIIGSGYPELTDARIALRENNSGVDALIQKVPTHLLKDEGLMLDRAKWRRKNEYYDGALAILNAEPETSSNSSSWWREKHIIIRELLQDKDFPKAYSVATSHGKESGLDFAQGEWLSGWIALEMLDNSQKAFSHFEKLYNNTNAPISKSRGSFWAGYAAYKIKRNDVAVPWLKEAAKYYGTFYGQIAADMLGQKLEINRRTQINISETMQKEFYNNDFIYAAKILSDAGLYSFASKFVETQYGKCRTPEDYYMLANFANSIGLKANALVIAKKAAYHGYEFPEYLYPVLEPVQVASIRKDIIPLVHAIIRQESAFDPRATSRTGARGLMQLMPATAKEQAAQLGLAHRTEHLTSVPEHNIKIGTAYLEKMLDRYNGSHILAIAAYDAGFARVDRWLEEFGDPRNQNVNKINWIESIPIYETRNYVQRVMESERVYREMFSQNAMADNSPSGKKPYL